MTSLNLLNNTNVLTENNTNTVVTLSYTYEENEYLLEKSKGFIVK